MNKKFYEELGRTMQQYRIDCRLTQQDVAERMSIARSTLASWESGARGISIDDLIKFANVLNIDPNVLYQSARKYLYK